MKQLNTCLTFVKIPSSSRGLAALSAGKIDMLFAVTYNQERDKIGRFSCPYRNESIRIFWRPQKPSILSTYTLEQLLLHDFKGVVNRGSYAGDDLEALKSIYENQQLFEASSLNQRISMLKRGRVDFSIEDQWAGLHYIHKNRLKDIQMHPYVIYENDVSLFFSRETVSEIFVTAVNEVIEQHGNEIDRILTANLLK